jgi:protein SCO1/2
LLKGKSVVVNLIYTHCKDECPLETAKLVQVQRLLAGRVGKDIFFYSISIDPKRDTPQVLKAYADKFGVGPGWLFLTGREADIALIGKKLGLSSRNDFADRDGHQPSLMIGNEPTGQWMRNSAVDNPRFLASKIGTFLNNGNQPVTVPVTGYALARPIDGLDPGSHLFSMRCSACHTIGQGDAVGPDLLGVTTRRDRAWLERYLAEPERMLAERDPVATALFDKYKSVRMPNLRLGHDDVAALLSYLEARSNAAQPRERKAAALAR